MLKSEQYEDLGLNNNEGKVYETLIEHGKLGSSEISSYSGVPYGKIYVVLNSLIRKGFVKIIPGKIKKFISADPQKLLSIIEEKEKSLADSKNKIQELKKFYADNELNPVVMVTGLNGFIKIVSEMKEPEKYDYSIKWISACKPEWLKVHRIRIKKGVDIRNLSRYDNETKENIDKWLKINKNVRKLENEGVALSIIDDKEVMLGLIKSNVTLLIKDQAFAKIMKKLFLACYETADKIK